MFAAGAATSAEGRDLFVDRLVKFLKANIVNAAFPESVHELFSPILFLLIYPMICLISLYETETAQFPGRSNTSTWRIEFINRPVTGYVFSLMEAFVSFQVFEACWLTLFDSGLTTEGTFRY